MTTPIAHSRRANCRACTVARNTGCGRIIQTQSALLDLHVLSQSPYWGTIARAMPCSYLASALLHHHLDMPTHLKPLLYRIHGIHDKFSECSRSCAACDGLKSFESRPHTCTRCRRARVSNTSAINIVSSVRPLLCPPSCSRVDEMITTLASPELVMYGWAANAKSTKCCIPLVVSLNREAPPHTHSERHCWRYLNNRG